MSSDSFAIKRWGLLCVLAAILFGTTARVFLKRRNRPAVLSSNIQFQTRPLIPFLHINSVVPHGDIAEINGTTDPGVIVMINGQQAAVVFDGNRFHHFVGPLPKGTTIVSVTCQNEEGGTVTQKLAITIE